MKTMFKFLFTLVLLAALALPQLARAEVGLKSFGITNSIAAASVLTSAVNLGTTVKIDNRDNCSMVFNGFGSTAQTGNILITFARSADGVTWENSPTVNWVVAVSNGATTNTCTWTNWPQSIIGSAGYLKLVGLNNSNSTCIFTNASLYLVDKKPEVGAR